MDNEIATSAEALEQEVLPRRYEVHSDPDRSDCDEPAESLTGKPPSRKSAAEWAYERLILYIQDFEKRLDNEHEVAMGFAGGASGVLKIEGMGFFDPDIITFYGTDPSGAKTQLVQHVSQLSVILQATVKEQPAKAPNRIGFRLRQALENT